MNKTYRKILILLPILFVFTFSIYVTIENHEQDSFTNHRYSQKISSDSGLYGIFATSKGTQNGKLEVIPGGHSIGVTLQTKGVLVVGYAPVITEEQKEAYPAKEAGIEIGDVILNINGIKAENDLQVAKEIDQSCANNQEISIGIKQNGKIIEKKIRPVYCKEMNRYRVGLYIRDEAAGVGTLTFLDPKSNKYGALGHVITDVDTNDQIELSNGKIVESSIYAIEKGKRGDPGEKIGTFLSDSTFTGSIETNSSSGIFGKVEGRLSNPFFQNPIPIGWKSEIETGPAKIYTVLKDNQIQEFDIRIEKVMLYRNDNKNMILRVTDSLLLEKTGGIVQGMSGSPIIQNGKIIGAVTHVFVNDSSRGYGVFIEKMLDESGLLNQSETALIGGSFYYIVYA